MLCADKRRTATSSKGILPNSSPFDSITINPRSREIYRFSSAISKTRFSAIILTAYFSKQHNYLFFLNTLPIGFTVIGFAFFTPNRIFTEIKLCPF